MALIANHVIADAVFCLLLITVLVLAFFWFHPWRGRKVSHAREKAVISEEQSSAPGIRKRAA